MSDGSRYHRDSMICAHKSFPLGTLLKVTNPANGAEVIVKVTDRGPFKRKRIIDLSFGAAYKLGILSKGVAFVEVVPYKSIVVPYRADNNDEIPTLDLEMTDDAYNSIPQWKEEVMGDKKLPKKIYSTNSRIIIKKNEKEKK